MLGWVLTCFASGMEASAHIAEDTRTPSRTVPLAMFWGVAATYSMGWVVSDAQSDVGDPLSLLTLRDAPSQSVLCSRRSTLPGWTRPCSPPSP